METLSSLYQNPQPKSEAGAPLRLGGAFATVVQEAVRNDIITASKSNRMQMLSLDTKYPHTLVSFPPSP